MLKEDRIVELIKETTTIIKSIIVTIILLIISLVIFLIEIQCIS